MTTAILAHIGSCGRVATRCALVGLMLVTAAGTAAAQTKFSVGLWGDMPYAKAGDAPKIPALLDSINAADIAFSIYDGDIKDGSSKCTDDVFAKALTMFGAMSKPVVYIPGDNEWTDCHRLNNGSYDNLERLSYTRKVMFPTSGVLGAGTLPVERQGKPGEKFVENMRYLFNGVMFVGLNIPGSNNNRVVSDKDCTSKSARTPAQCEVGNAEYAERDAANIVWLKESFAKAKSAGAAGLMMVFQGDPGFDWPETEEVDESRLAEKDGYAKFLDTVIAETKAYAGQVVMVHGDTHFFKVDKPLINATNLLANFTRLQTFGSPNIHWVRADIDPASKHVFTFVPMIVDANVNK